MPPDFKFSVKLSKYFTHEKRLGDASQLSEKLFSIYGLREKLGVLLIQLPPSLEFEKPRARHFFHKLRVIFAKPIVIEPRHPSWGSGLAISTLEDFQICKALAHPEKVPISKPARMRVESLRYFRLHGAPLIYKSPYDHESLERLKSAIEKPLSEAHRTWVIFDNTTFGHATSNALELKTFFEAPN